MAPMKISWHTEGAAQLASEWIESEAIESYSPAWMQSSYPCEASAQRSNTNQTSSMSPFGETAPFAVRTKIPTHFQ